MAGGGRGEWGSGWGVGVADAGGGVGWGGVSYNSLDSLRVIAVVILLVYV